jgi:uncharacterized membrane protein YraQ (UPF0718 family)
MADLTQNPRPVAAAWARIDKVFLTGLLIVAVLAVFDRPAVIPTLEEMLEHFWGTLPFILFAVAAIAWMKASGSERLLDGAFKGRETRMILIGALVGGLSPFCSCQVIPFVAALLAAGAPLSAVMAFWLSSPLMDPAMFAITAGGLGFDFAIAKTVAAVALGLAGGMTVKLLSHSPVFADPLRERPAVGGCCKAKKLSLKWNFWGEADRRRIFGDAALENLLFLGKWLMFAYLLQALLIRYVPADLIATVIGGRRDRAGDPRRPRRRAGVPQRLCRRAAPVRTARTGHEPRRRHVLRDRRRRQFHPGGRRGLGAGETARLRCLSGPCADRRRRRRPRLDDDRLTWARHRVRAFGSDKVGHDRARSADRARALWRNSARGRRTGPPVRLIQKISIPF